MRSSIIVFLEYLKIELNYSSKTIISYQNELFKYQKYIESNHINYLEIKREEIRRYLKYLDFLEYKNSSISRNLSAIRSFYKYLVLKNKINNNIWTSINNPKSPKKLPNYLDEIDTEKMLNFTKINGYKENIFTNRDKLIIEILYDTGCRCSELVSIKMDDINFSNKSIKIMGKGSKERIVYYGDYAQEILDKYLEDRIIILNNQKSDYLLVGKDSICLTTRRIAQILSNIAFICGIKNKVTPHVIRHTFATHMLNHGSNIRGVQEILGHSSLSTTQIYAHVSNERLRKVYLYAKKR